MYRALVGGLLFGARAVLLSCVGRLVFLMRVCLRWFPALASGCLCMPQHCVPIDDDRPSIAVGQWQTNYTESIRFALSCIVFILRLNSGALVHCCSELGGRGTAACTVHPTAGRALGPCTLEGQWRR